VQPVEHQLRGVLEFARAQIPSVVVLPEMHHFGAIWGFKNRQIGSSFARFCYVQSADAYSRNRVSRYRKFSVERTGAVGQVGQQHYSPGLPALAMSVPSFAG
jgi:hypothetical protein